jgi:hypothetical protein
LLSRVGVMVDEIEAHALGGTAVLCCGCHGRVHTEGEV